MRLAHRRIKDNDTDLGIARTNRTEWAVATEPLVISKAPLPISYDVDCTQGMNFAEFSYTEFLGGIFISTQNVEMNCKIRKAAAGHTARTDHLKNLSELNVDKYVLDRVQPTSFPAHVGFMVGHNMFDLVSPEVTSRIAFENKEFVIKLHPLTNMDYAATLAKYVGWDRIISANISGIQLLENCRVAYVTTATELCPLAVAKGKKIVNLSSFFHEAGGAYYSLNTLLFKANNPAETLNNIIDCPFSGIILPWMDDVEERIEAFYQKAVEMRDIHAPLASTNLLQKIPTTAQPATP